MRQAEPIHSGPVHLMKRATELGLGDRGGSDHRQHHGLPHKVHISSHGPEPFLPSPACLSRIVGSHTPYASCRLWMNIVPFRYLGMHDPFFPLRLIISLHLANDHTLSPTKLLLQPYSRVCLRKKLRGQPGRPRFPRQPPPLPTHTAQHRTKYSLHPQAPFPRWLRGDPPVFKSCLPRPLHTDSSPLLRCHEHHMHTYMHAPTQVGDLP